MLILGKDYRYSDIDGALEIAWNGEWLTPSQIAYSEDTPNSSMTLVNRFHQAIVTKDSKYKGLTVEDLVMRPADGKKAITGRIDQCPKVLAVDIVWVCGAGVETPTKLWLHTTTDAVCDEEFYANGRCRNCWTKTSESRRNTNGARLAAQTDEAKAKAKKREESPQRTRNKTLSKRRVRLVPQLIEMQTDPMSLAGITLIAQQKFVDLTEAELPKFAQQLYELYEFSWLVKNAHDPLGAAKLAKTKNAKLTKQMQTATADAAQRKRGRPPLGSQK